MLILSRKRDESLIINGDIEIIVTGITGSKVSLGIVAPPNVAIFRKELGPSTLNSKAPKKLTTPRSKAKRWNVLSKVQSLGNTIR